MHSGRRLNGSTRSLNANIAWNTTGKLAYAASRALVLLLLAKLGSAAMVGQYALAFAITSPVFMLTDLDLRSILSTSTEGEDNFHTFLHLRVANSCVAMVVVAAIALLQSDAETRGVILLVGLAKGIESISDMIYGLLQKNERLDKIGISLMIKSGLSVATIALPLLWMHSLVIGALGMTVAFLVLLAVYDIPAARAYTRMRGRWQWRPLVGLARLSLPLGLVLMFSSVIKNLSNYFIEAFHGAAALGYFSSIVYIMVTGSLLVSALSQSASARLAQLYARGDRDGFVKLYRRIVLQAAVLGAGMLLITAVGGKQILTLLYQPDYAAWSGVFTAIMGAAMFSYIGEITAAALTAVHAFVIQPMIGAIVLLVGLCANFVLVPWMGLEGAAICLILTSMVQAALNAAVLRAKLQVTAVTAGQGKTEIRPVELEALERSGFLAQWKALLEKSGGEDVFAQPEVLLCWWNTVGSKGKNANPQILAVYHEGMLVAVFPLVNTRRWGVQRTAFMGAPQATHCVVAYLPEYAQQAAAAVVAHLRGNKAVCLLGGLRRESALYRAMEGALRSTHGPTLATGVPSPYIAARGMPYEALFATTFSAHAAKNARRDDKRMGLLGQVCCRELTADDMAAACALHDKRWRKKIDTSGFTDENSREFFTALLRRRCMRWEPLALGLFVDDKLLAFQYGFVCGNRALLYKSAHDDDFGIYAPGKMLKRQYIQRCLSRGIGVVDLGIGYEEYKLEWTDREDTILELLFAGRGWISHGVFAIHCLAARLKAALKCSRRVVLFRRNTLGRIRFALSPTRFASDVLAVARHILGRRPHRSESSCDVPVTIRSACLRDIDSIAAMMHCPTREVVSRFYRLQQCYVGQTDAGICCAAWVVMESPARAVICDLVADKRLCRGQHISRLLDAIHAQLRGGPMPHGSVQLTSKVPVSPQQPKRTRGQSTMESAKEGLT